MMPRRLVLDLLDRRTGLADVRQQQRDAAAALGQLQRRVDAARDRLHVVFDAQQEARDELAALRLAGVEERRRRRLEPAGDDLVDELDGELLVAVGEAEGRHDDAVLEPLEVALAVEGLQRVARVVLERAEEGLEPELLRVGEVVELLDELERVLREHRRLVVLLLDEVVEALLERVEEHRVLVHVLQEVLPRSALVGVELDLAVRVVQVQHRVEGVVVHPLESRLGLEVLLGHCSFHHRSNPSLTRSTSSGVPNTSSRYKCGTRHLRLMISPAMQKCSPKLELPAEMTPRMRSAIALIVEESDHLLGDGALLFPSTLASAIGRGDEDERLVDDERGIRRVERDPHRPHPELLDESGGVARDAREVDEQRRLRSRPRSQLTPVPERRRRTRPVARRARRSCRDGSPTSGPHR